MLPTGSLLAIFIFSFLVALAAVTSPGPISTAIVSQAPRRGWVVGPLVATGHIVLELIIVLLIVLGLGAGLARPGVQTAIALVGGVVLLWMGAGLLWAVWRGKIHLPGSDERQSPLSAGRLVGLGMLATITNPFWYAWWVTAGAGYLAQTASLGAVAAFYLGHISADYAWDTLLSTVVGGGRRWITERVYQALILVCGLFFLYLAWGFLSQGIAGLAAAA